MTQFLEVGERAARAAGAILLDWRGRFGVREKGPADLVTEADFAAQEAIHRIVLEAFPDHDFLGEENPHARIADGRLRWVVDPLDGTLNYVHGVAQYAVSIALEQAGQLLVGVIYDPVADECFTAEQGAGAWLNGQRLATSGVAALKDALVAVSFPTQVRPDALELHHFLRVVGHCQATRRMGSSALNLAYVAAGRFDGFWATETKAWDIAAGVLLVAEAGGTVTDLEGGPIDLARPRFVAAASEPLHRELRSRLEV